MLSQKRTILFIGGVFVLAAFILVNPYRQIIDHRVISWDGAGYYLYLPSAFIYHDFKSLSYFPHIFHQYPISSTFYQAFKVGNGNYVFNYPMGTAILQLPFFLIAHLIASFTSYPADGFSTPYQFMIVVAGLFYCLWGLILLYKLLAEYFGEVPALISCLAIFLGTNLYNYAYTEPCMSHVYLFFLVCAVLYLFDRWYVKATAKYSLLLGAAIGLILASRPTVGIVLIVPLLWKVDSLKRFTQNLTYIAGQWKHVLLSLLVAAVPVCLEMYYWKSTTGHWLFNTYGYQGVGFEFKIKHILYGLIGMQKGWFVYTPLIIAMVAGFFVIRKHKPEFVLPVALYIVINVLIVFSWQIWYYGGGFSARAMVESYAVLALPFAGLIANVFTNRIKGALIFVFIFCCCLLNLFQTWQYNNKVIYTVGLSSMYEYEKFFLSPVRDVVPKEYIDKEGLVLPAHIQSVTLLLDSTYLTEGALCNEKHLYFKPAFYSGKEIKSIPGNRLRFTVRVGYKNDSSQLYNAPASLFIGFERKGSMYFVNSQGIPSAFTTVKPGTETIELQVPGILKDNDVCKVYVTNNTPVELRVYGQKIEMLKVK